MFYLKYRPQTVEELDLKKVRERLRDILGRELPHAFLFAGPRGAGKTSAARIIAKAVNCEQKPSASFLEDVRHGIGSSDFRSLIEPCNECESCKSITQGRHLDIIEIDAASNRGIDQIRDLRDKIGLSPSSAKYKVYIIDEVHMLTKEAFNALLKTLEEPPKHAIFILATTEPHRLPETVKSRCVQIEFAKAGIKEIVRSLKRVVQGENLKVEGKTLEYIAGLVDGSFRDATKILEEAAGRRGVVDIEDIDRVYGGSSGEVRKFIGLLAKKNAKELLEYINRKAEDGLDIGWLTRAALDQLHGEFLAGYGIGNFENRGDQENRGNLGFKKGEIVRLMRLLEEASREERTAVVEQMPLEIAVIEWCETKAKS